MKKLTNEKGVSLISIIIVLVIVLIATGIISMIVLSSVKDEDNTVDESVAEETDLKTISSTSETYNIGYYDISDDYTTLLIKDYAELSDYIMLYASEDGEGENPVSFLADYYPDSYFSYNHLGLIYVPITDESELVSYKNTVLQFDSTSATVHYMIYSEENDITDETAYEDEEIENDDALADEDEEIETDSEVETESEDENTEDSVENVGGILLVVELDKTVETLISKIDEY